MRAEMRDAATHAPRATSDAGVRTDPPDFHDRNEVAEEDGVLSLEEEAPDAALNEANISPSMSTGMQLGLPTSSDHLASAHLSEDGSHSQARSFLSEDSS